MNHANPTHYKCMIKDDLLYKTLNGSHYFTCFMGARGFKQIKITSYLPYSTRKNEN